MKKILFTIALIFGLIQFTGAVGTLSSVYINPVSGNDDNAGSHIYPVKTWDKALQLAANNATIYVTWAAISITSNTTIDGSLYGATNITVMPYTGYTGALFAVAGGVTGTFSNITLKGIGTAQALLSANSGGTLSIGGNLNITDGGKIALDGGANPINLTAAPPAGMKYELLTTYLAATDEGRAIVTAGSVSNPLQYFTLIEPASTTKVSYELDLDGTTIRLYERPIAGIYLDPLNGNDAYSGAKSSRPIKTLAKAIALWNERNVVVPGINVFILTRVTLTENVTLDNGIIFKRFERDNDRPIAMTDYLFVYSDQELTINNATINNGATSGIALHNEKNGKLTLNNGATLISANSSNVIESRSYGIITMNAGATITSTGSGGYAIYSYAGSGITINGGTITTNGSAIYKYNGTLIIHDVTINHTGNGECIYNYYGTTTIHNATITTKANSGILNYYGTMTINGGQFTSDRPAIGYLINNSNSGTMIINGGTFVGNKTTAVHNTSGNGITLNAGTFSSTNTTNGAVYSTYSIQLNGENVQVTGVVCMASAAMLESRYINIISPTVTQNYTLKILPNTPYTALVKSNPIIDLGPYESKFTLAPIDGYQLTAYANKGQGPKNLVLYNPNGIYVNDYTGVDTNTGTSPASPVKTLANAAAKTTTTKTTIFICDSILVINTPQNISPSVKDTISSFMFRANSYLMRITTGGSLTLKNTTVYSASSFVTRFIQIDDGSLTLNEGAEIIAYGKYGIYQMGGNVVMNDGSLIKYHPTNNSSVSGYGLTQTGNTSTATINSGAIIQNQSYGIQLTGSGTVDIKDSVAIQNGYYALYVSGTGTINVDAAKIQNNHMSYPAIYATNGTINLNGTIVRNNGYQAISITGTNTILNMTDGQIINNGIQGSASNTTYQGTVSIDNRATFHMSGGLIAENNIPSKTNNSIYGEQVRIRTGATMHFTGGTIKASMAERNAVYIHSESTNVLQQTSRLILNNAAVLDSGFIYCSNPYNAPISLSEPLNPTKKFNINLGDNMAGCILVDGTSAGTFPASVTNFVLNPNINTLSLSQSGNNVIVGSTAIYLDGTYGLDTNDGSSAALAVKTFKRARERLQATNGNYIIIINAALLSNVDEIDTWDLSFNPNAVVKRGLGYTGYLVQVTSGKSLTLSDITFDGDQDNFDSGNAILYNYLGTITINAGTTIRNNYSYGIQNNSGSIYMNGGTITKNKTYAVYNTSSLARSDAFIMTGGSITENTGTGIYNDYLKYMRLSGGEISKNTSDGIYTRYNNNAGVYEISGTAKITENGGRGFYSYSSSYYLDSLIISGGEISLNSNYGINCYANHVSITGGSINHNNGYGIFLTTATNATSSFSMTGGTISDNNLNYGMQIQHFKKVEMKNATISNNYAGVSIANCTDISVDNTEISHNRGYGIQISGNSITNQGSFTMKSGVIHNNNSYGIYINNNYLSYAISGNVQITNNRNNGIYSNSLLPSSISGNVLIKENKASNGGGFHIVNGTVNISDSVTFEADTCTSYGGAIYVATNGKVIISGDVKIKDCVSTYTSTSASCGGSAICALGQLSMTGGSITGSLSTYSNGTVYATGNSSNVNLTRVKISDNTARCGGAIFTYNGGKITLDSDTITNNTSTNESLTTPVTGNIHIQGGVNGRVFLRDRCVIDGKIFIYSTSERVHVDEALMMAATGAYHLLGSNSVTTPGTIVVSPNETTVTDASQFLSKFTLVNQNIGRGLDKGGTDEKHIIVVNQFFIDGTKPTTGNGANPTTAFNNLTQLTATILQPYTTVWVSGPVTVTGSQSIPAAVSSRNNVNLRRYTGFAVAAQEFPSYDSVLITINEGATLTIPGGNSAANRFTISGEGGSSLTDASIFKNNGTLNIGGHTRLYFNPTAGNADAIYQNGTLNLSGNVEFELYGTNTVYLPEGKVIHINGLLNSTLPIGITVETSPTDTHYPGRIVATGTTTNIPAGTENKFYNELVPPNLPIGRAVTGTTADLMFYIADRNVAGVPIYTTLQDAFDASVPANNDEVRLYGDTEEAVTVDKTLRYNSQGFNVVGSFTLDSTSNVQLLDDLLADTLYIRATTFSKKAQLDLNTFDATILKAAYLDLRLPENAVISDWYPVNLPFDASLADIRNVADTTALMLHLQDYAVAAYDGQRRANFGIGNQPSNPDNDWQYFTGSQMTNGTGYMVTTKGIQALRFKAANLNLFSATTAPMTYFIGSAGAAHQGFNYIAQPMSINSTITGGIPVGGIVQTSESLSSDRIGAASYVAKTVSSALVVAPYTNYFYQTNTSGTVSYTKSTAAATVRSGKPSVYSDVVSSDVPEYYEIRLFDNDPERYDALFVAASEYASDADYEIGRDVVKMGTTGGGGVMQLWSKDFDLALCANEVKLENGSADIPLFIHTPIAGKEYTLSLHNVVSYSQQLWLCKADKLVQNLTLYPEYIIEGTGDTTEEYSLKLLSGTTSNEPVSTGEIYVYTENKTIILVGLQPGDDYLIYDTAGRLHKAGKADSNRTRINAGSGTYVVKTNDKIFKAIVK